MPSKHQHPNQASKKKKGHHPAHQNSFAFRHNPKSKLTDKILASPNVGLCRRCHDKVEWRKQYRKYKPLSQPATCNLCKRRNITAAYHTICDRCATSDVGHRKMMLNNGNEKKSSNEIVENAAAAAESSESPASISTKRTKQRKVCAMCVKEYAKEDENGENDIETEIEEKTLLLEEKLNRPLRLREKNAIERKVCRAHEQEKARLKEERRRARWGDEDQEIGDDIIESDEGGEIEEEGEEKEEDVDENDDFLQAVGGKDKLLTGEAYQQMLLKKTRFDEMQISN